MEDLIVHYDIHTRRQQADSEQAFGEVLQAIAPFEAQRRHCTRQSNRHTDIGNSLIQKKSGLNHRIRAVRDHDWGILAKEFLNRRQDQLSVSIRHFEAVLVD